MEDKADDVVKVFAFSQGGKNYLIAMEYLFQVSSKESGSHGTFISGHNDVRLSVYDIENGEIISRKDLGKARDDDGSWLLGVDSQCIWLYSIENGLYALEPTSLDVKIKYEDFLKANPEIKEQLVQSEYNHIFQHYGFDNTTQKVLIKDKQANIYTFNSSSLKVEKGDDLNLSYDFGIQYTSNSATFKGNRLYLDGTDKKEVQYKQTVLNPDLTYLQGEVILDKNFERLYNEAIQELEALQSTGTTANNSNGRISIDRQNRIFTREKERLEGEIKDIKSGSLSISSKTLQSEEANFFIFYRESTEKTAKVKIASLSLENELSEKWNLILPNTFFDKNAASEAEEGGFFSKGNPSYDFQFFDIVDNKLIIIYHLKANCVDTTTGKLLWSFRM